MQFANSYWIEPIPDADVCSNDAGPEEKASLQQSIRLAFITALQKLPPKQRAVLLMAAIAICLDGNHLRGLLIVEAEESPPAGEAERERL